MLVASGDGSAALSWSVPTGEVISYTVTVSPGGRTITTTQPSLTVTGLTNGLSYTFTVSATNTAGTGSPSAASVVVVPGPTGLVRPVPPPPTDLGRPPQPG